MTQYLMIKAFGRALLVTLVLITIGAALWFYTLVTIILIVLGWLWLMFYTDPPENWD